MSTVPQPHLLENERWKKRRIGILGGSFNPPHEGHKHISLAAIKALKLDYVWWLVTPQNPLKEERPMDFEERLERSRALVAHPKILVTDLERNLGTQTSYETVIQIKKHFPSTRFVWISGMDNALSLHNWDHWQELLKEIAMLHLTRHPAKSLVRACPLRLYQKQKHRVLDKPGRFSLKAGITYWMMQSKMINVSSTEIREREKFHSKSIG